MLSNTPRLNFSYLKIIHILHSCYHPKTIGHVLKIKEKKASVSLPLLRKWHDILKIKMKTKNRSHRYDINRPRSRHGQKYSKYKKYLSIMMLICIKQRVSNIWSSVHEKVMQHWDWFKKSVAYKKVCNAFSGYFWKCSSYYFSSSSLKFFAVARNHQIIRHFYLW